MPCRAHKMSWRGRAGLRDLAQVKAVPSAGDATVISGDIGVVTLPDCYTRDMLMREGWCVSGQAKAVHACRMSPGWLEYKFLRKP